MSAHRCAKGADYAKARPPMLGRVMKLAEVYENETIAKIIERKGRVLIAPHYDIGRVCIMNRSFCRGSRGSGETCYGVCHPARV